MGVLGLFSRPGGLQRERAFRLMHRVCECGSHCREERDGAAVVGGLAPTLGEEPGSGGLEVAQGRVGPMQGVEVDPCEWPPLSD
jgi:hypothetical protein